jgi:hypothetical protein
MGDWHVGQMVRCVDGSVSPDCPDYVRFPFAGCCYTIRDVVLRYDARGREGVGFLLEELVNPPLHYSGQEPAFKTGRFVPIRKTSIDIFRSLLTPTGQEGPASPVLPVRVPALDHVSHEGTCQFPQSDEALRLPAGRPSVRPTAARLALKLDGAPLSHSCKSSVKSTSQLSPVDSKETSRCRRISPSSRSIAPQLRSVL